MTTSEDFKKNAETGCCQKFDPTQYEDKEVVFSDKLFVKDHVTSFLRMPLNFGKVMTRMIAKIDEAKALSSDFLMLSDEKSLWGADILIAVKKEVPGAVMYSISGTFMTRVFEGPYSNMGKWIKNMHEYVKSEGKELKKLYFYYSTCPKCAKHYGKNYVVVFAQVQ